MSLAPPGIWAGGALAAQISPQFVLSNGENPRICAVQGAEHKFIKSRNHVVFVIFVWRPLLIFTTLTQY